eukprot:scaffold39963_cov45-Attheya_sp.AAC.2
MNSNKQAYRIGTTHPFPQDHHGNSDNSYRVRYIWYSRKSTVIRGRNGDFGGKRVVSDAGPLDMVKEDYVGVKTRCVFYGCLSFYETMVAGRSALFAFRRSAMRRCVDEVLMDCCRNRSFSHDLICHI